MAKRAYRLSGLDCANCAAKIEAAVGRLPGVISASVNFMTAKMTIEAEDSLIDDVCAKAAEIVNRYEPDVVVKRA